MLRRIERIVTPVVKAFNGRVVKSIGDAYMIIFRSPTTAVRCATAVQDRLYQMRAHGSGAEETRLRIAMNLGEVRVHRGDVFGEPVNIAARLEGVTPADEIYVSESIYLSMNQTGIPLEKVGEYELKGIPEPVTVYRVRKASEESPEGDAGDNKALPYGGQQMQQFSRMRWTRRLYNLMWILAVAGLIGAAYLRYRPSGDYNELIEKAKKAAEAGDATSVLAAAGQIPAMASQARSSVRRYRQKAVTMLLEEQDYEAVEAELDSLLEEAPRDPETLMLNGLYYSAKDKHEEALKTLSESLKLNASLGKRPGVARAVLEGYRIPTLRSTAEHLVESVLQEAAVPVMAKALTVPEFADRAAKRTIANRLEKLGHGHEVDWVLLAIDDLKATSCKVRKNAIGKLLTESDERAVGPLMILAESKGCHAKYARNTANAILGK